MYTYEGQMLRPYSRFRRSFTRGKFSRTEPFMDLVVSTYISKARDRRSTLVFCSSKQTSADFAELFEKAGVRCRFVTGDTDHYERETTISQFKAGLFPVLVNCQVFTEGADMPAVSTSNVSGVCTDLSQIDVVILARPTKSENAVTQMVSTSWKVAEFTVGPWDSTFAKHRQRLLPSTRYVRCAGRE
jgi:ATP-dependent helicase IRC3